MIIKELNEIKKLLIEEKQKNKQLNNIVDELIQEKKKSTKNTSRRTY